MTARLVGINHVALEVDDIEQALEFYGSLFEISLRGRGPSMAFIDFGFLEPAVLASLPRLARSGGKMPEKLNGRLAVRVAVGYDSLAGLHQQIGQVLKGLNTARAAAAAKKPAK